MAEEEVAAYTEETATDREEETGETEEVIDLNAALLEVMVKRTELLEKLMEGAMNVQAFIEEDKAIAMPSLEKRRRRRRAA